MNRLEEIEKLRLFKAFRPLLLSQVPESAKIFRFLWVESPLKSRLTLQDRKSEHAEREITHVPTPSALTNAVLEFLAFWWGWPLVQFDIVAAFPHAAEQQPDVYMWPPLEWVQRFGAALEAATQTFGIWWQASTGGRRRAQTLGTTSSAS